jgi:hypothetical protein
LKKYGDERKEGVCSSPVVKFSFHSLGFERKSKKGGEKKMDKFLNDL